MTKGEFETLQLQHRQSGRSLKQFLSEKGVCYSSYNPIRTLKHGRKAKSLVKYGLEEIATMLLRPTYIPKFDVFKFLSYT